MTLAEQRTDELLAAIGARRSSPGGGAVAALTQALGAALAEMVVRFTIPAAAADDTHADVRAMVTELDGWRREALELADQDATAFAELSRLWKLDADDPQRRTHWKAAVQNAIEVPRRVLRRAVELLQLLAQLPGSTNRNLDSDLAIAAVLAEAAARAAAWNVRINLPQVDDAELVRELRAETVGHVERAADLRARVENAIRYPLDA